jgi:hypothetical protein
MNSRTLLTSLLIQSTLFLGSQTKVAGRQTITLIKTTKTIPHRLLLPAGQMVSGGGLFFQPLLITWLSTHGTMATIGSTSTTSPTLAFLKPVQ